MTDQSRCIAITGKGDQCLKPALRKRAVCAVHAASSGSSRLEDLEAPSLDIIRQALTADAESVEPGLRIKMALQVLDRLKRQPPAPPPAPADDGFDVYALNDEERDRLGGLLMRLREFKAEVRARLAEDGRSKPPHAS